MPIRGRAGKRIPLIRREMWPKGHKPPLLFAFFLFAFLLALCFRPACRGALAAARRTPVGWAKAPKARCPPCRRHRGDIAGGQRREDAPFAHPTALRAGKTPACRSTPNRTARATHRALGSAIRAMSLPD